MLGSSIHPVVQVIARALACFVLVSWATVAQAEDAAHLVNADPDSNVAIRGYDPVAYFTEGRPTKGSPDHSYAWRDAEWHFANAEHRDSFAAEPARYAPQYGGFCAMAMTQGVVQVIDPEAWTIVEGKLYLNFSLKGRTFFREDLEGNIEKSDGQWAELQPKT